MSKKSKAKRASLSSILNARGWPTGKIHGMKAQPEIAVLTPHLYTWPKGELAKAKKKKAAADREARANALKLQMHLRPAERKELLKLAPRPDDHRWPSEIDVGKRFRKKMGDIDAMARSIEHLTRDGQPGLLQPIGITPADTLIWGERRLLGWRRSTVRLTHPIPVRTVDISSIIEGEYVENDPNLRQNFTLEEAVDIVRAMRPKQREMVGAEQAARPSETRAAPGRKAAPGQASGRVADRAASYVGKDRKTIAKAEQIVAAAEEDPERFRPLVDDMNRSGRADGPFKRLQIMQATDKIRNLPPPLPGNGPYTTMVIDFPWAFEGAADQEEIDAAGRSLRPYPAMSIKSGCHFLRDQVAPLLGTDCTVWFWVTNHHLVKGYHQHLLAALGFPDGGNTKLTWVKMKDGRVQIGRGAILRDATEDCIMLTRGKPVINVLGEDPPTTVLFAPRGENSRKPEAFYRLVERVSPAQRYASIFSTGGEGALWDGHGDQVEKHAPAAAGDELAEWKALGAIEAGVSIEGPIFTQLQANRLIAGETDRPNGWTLTSTGADRLAALEAKVNAPKEAAIEPWRFQLAALSRVEGNPKADISDIDPQLYDGLIEGKRSRKLTARGRAQLTQLRQLTTLEALEAIDKGELADLVEAERKQLVADGLVAGKAAKQRLTKHGARTLARLRDFRTSFFAAEEVADETVATSEYQRDMGFPVSGGYRQTPAGESTVPDIVKPDMIVRTNYETGPYRVLEVSGPHYMEDDRAKAYPHWSLCMVRADEKKKGRKARSADSWINEVVAVGGRLLMLFEANTDEVFIAPAEGSSPAEDPQGADRGAVGAPAEKKIPPALRFKASTVRDTPAPDGHWIALTIDDAGEVTTCQCGSTFHLVDANWTGMENEILAHWAAAPDQAAIDAFENADLYRIPRAVIDAITARGGHAFTRTIDWDGGGEKGTSVATCQCGVTFRADRTLPYSGENAIVPQEEAHWRAVLFATAAAPAAVPASPAGLEMPEIPAILRRQAAG